MRWTPWIWTCNPPSHDGYYWWRWTEFTKPEVVQVRNGFVGCCGHGSWIASQHKGGEWHGPILSPLLEE